MAMVVINGKPGGIDRPARTWGELLDRLETDLAACGHVVAAVQLNGVNEPAFRSAEALATPLDADTDVSVETARPLDLIRDALDEGEKVLATILVNVQTLAGAFRRGDIDSANETLAECWQSLFLLLGTTATAAKVAGVDLSAVGEGHESAEALAARLTGCTDSLLAAQGRGEWTTVAEIIERDFAGIVSRWSPVLNAIRRAVPGLEETAA